MKAELIYTVCCRHKPHFSNLAQSHGTQASNNNNNNSIYLNTIKNSAKADVVVKGR